MICTAIANISYKECLSILPNEEMAEIRIDMLNLTEKELQNIFSSHKNLIATCRETPEFNESKRGELLKLAILSGAKYVDIEIDTASKIFIKELVSFAKNNHCQVILSYHNFKETPKEEDLQQIINDCFNEGASIAKLACQTNTIKDSARILSLYNTNENIVALGMGKHGVITRIASTKLGAPFTFASLNSENITAEGQLDKETINEIFSKLS